MLHDDAGRGYSVAPAVPTKTACEKLGIRQEDIDRFYFETGAISEGQTVTAIPRETYDFLMDFKNDFLRRSHENISH